MTKIKDSYKISNLYIEKRQNKIAALFEVNSLNFRLCLFGYSEAEQNKIELERIMFDDDYFIDFMLEFFEMYRTLLKKYVKMKNQKINNEFTNEIEKAQSVNGISLSEYKKRIRTTNKIFGA